MKSKPSSKIFQKRIKELEKVATRIERRIAKLDKIVTDLSKRL